MNCEVLDIIASNSLLTAATTTPALSRGTVKPINSQQWIFFHNFLIKVTASDSVSAIIFSQPCVAKKNIYHESGQDLTIPGFDLMHAVTAET